MANHNITGIGLGLCICKAIVEQFNGEITFISALNKGTTFKFSFDLDYEDKVVSDMPVVRNPQLLVGFDRVNSI